MDTQTLKPASYNDMNRRYDTQLAINFDNYRVSYLPFLNMVVYTNITRGCGSEFVPEYGPLEPNLLGNYNDELIKNEIMNHLEKIS